MPWRKAGFATTKEVPCRKKGKLKITEGNLIVDKDYVLKRLNADTVTIIDARMKRFYDGETTGNPRDGHITSAKVFLTPKWKIPVMSLNQMTSCSHIFQ